MNKITFVLCLVAICFSAAAQNSNIKALCFNIRYDNAADGEFAWKNRRQAVVQMLKREKPAIIGMQEVLKNQLDYIGKQLPDYHYIGVGREDGKSKGEYAPIFFDKGILTLVKSGHFWLSSTPDTPSKGWDAACERIATWALFTCNKSQKQFICINTHFDHVGVMARLESAKMLLEKIKTLTENTPAIIMGDFNTTIQDVSLKPILDNFSNTRDCKVEFKNQTAYTYIGFESDRNVRALIDHIFINGFEVIDYRVLTDNFGIKQLSDHLPVVCDLKF